MYGLELLTTVFSNVQGIASSIMTGAGASQGVTELPQEIVDKIESVGMLESIPLWIETLHGSLLIRYFLCSNCTGRINFKSGDGTLWNTLRDDVKIDISTEVVQDTKTGMTDNQKQFSYSL